MPKFRPKLVSKIQQITDLIFRPEIRQVIARDEKFIIQLVMLILEF